MLKTVKNGSGIRVDPPPPCFFKIPTFSRFFLDNVPKLIIMKIGFAPAVYIFVSLEKEFPSFLIPRSFQYSLFWAVFMFFHINFTVTIHNVSIFLTLTLAVWRQVHRCTKKKIYICCNKTEDLFQIYYLRYIICFRYIMINDPLLAIDLTVSRCKKLLLLGYGEIV